MLNKKLIFNSSPISYSKHLTTQHQASLTNEAIQGIPNLEFFKQPTIGAFHQLYETKRKQASVYKFIFFSLGFLFTLLGTIIYFKTTNWKCDFYLGNSEVIKMFTYSVCLILAAIACAIGYQHYPEKETAQTLVTMMKKQITKLYRERQKNRKVEHGQQKEIVSFSNQDLYYQALDSIQEREDQTVQILKRIHIAKRLPFRAKERLFNQAICELQDYLNLVFFLFQKGEPIKSF